MEYQWFYKTPKGFSDIILKSDGEHLTGLYFEKSRDEEKHKGIYEEKDIHVWKETEKWLDIYFSGKSPDFTPGYKIENLTEFRREVINIMLSVPYGETVPYGEIAKRIAENHGMRKMSARAVGGAVGWNPLCLIVPCHRVIGANGALTGYGGGINNKIALLRLEQHDISVFHYRQR